MNLNPETEKKPTLNLAFYVLFQFNFLFLE
jgi:hypothetical protein